MEVCERKGLDLIMGSIINPSERCRVRHIDVCDCGGSKWTHLSPFNFSPFLAIHLRFVTELSSPSPPNKHSLCYYHNSLCAKPPLQSV